MCNALYHPPGCRCGFGGEGHLGKSGGRRTTWKHGHENFCRPSKCPYCGEEVFFVRHNGGSVWFDDLGKPWPKHGCFEQGEAEHSRQMLTRLSKGVQAPLMGVIV